MLIHTCCADCFLKFYQALSEKQRRVVQIFFYNPNIYPREEHSARLLALKKIVKSLDQEITIVVENYLPQQYFQALSNRSNYKKQLENIQKSNIFTIIPKETRCLICWELRLRALFETAKKKSLTAVSSTLLSSNYQDLSLIKKIAMNLSQEYQIDFYFPKMAKADRDKSNSGFYKQNYCGCLYSLLEKSREKYQI